MSAEPLHVRGPEQPPGPGPDRRHATAHGHLHDHGSGHGHERGNEHAHAPEHAFVPERAGQPHVLHGSHSKHASHAHTPAAAVPAEPIELTAGSPSLLMRGAGARVAGALVMVCALWLAVFWAVTEAAP